MTATVSVTLSRALIDLFPGAQATLTVEAATVADLITALDRRWPGMADRLRDETPAIRPHLNIFVDGEKATLATALQPGGRVYVLTAMSGG